MIAPGPHVVPAVALLLKLDTLGDLVLFAPALRALRTAWPTTRLCVLIRQSYVELAPWLAPGIEFHPTTFDPFAQAPDADAGELTRLRHLVASLRPDLVAAATSRRNWLEVALADVVPTARRVALGSDANDEFFSTQLRVHLRLDATQVFPEQVAIPPDEPDAQRNLRLASALLGQPAISSFQTLTLPVATRATAREFLAAHGLSPGRYVVCAAAGFANVALKTWPADRFAAAIRHLQERHGLPTLLIGHEHERTHLTSVVASCPTPPSGLAAPALWLGREHSLPTLAALIADSALYLGNDTGAMHLAAALDVPVVAIFGGGTWPRFTPLARRGFALVQPLPCFGCGWDCAFGTTAAPCLTGITAADAITALDDTLTQPATPFAVRPIERLPVSTRELIAASSAHYRSLRTAHLARQHKLEELTAFDREKDAAILEKETSIAEKEREINAKEQEIDSKEREINSKEREINSKEAEIQSKEREIHSKEREINSKEAEIHSKEREINSKEVEIHSKDAEITALKSVCDERERLIILQDGQIKHFQHTLADLTARHDAALADQAEFKATLTLLPPDIALATQALADRAVHIRNIEALVILRDREIVALKSLIAERDQSLENYATGHGSLEQAKRFGRLLAEKEAVLQVLNRACSERETLIHQLAADATDSTALLRKLWLAAAAHVRAKWWQPFEAWLFTRVVEKYWMQIGILRHHDPKPLVWDTLPQTPDPRPETPPPLQIALVTPSYGQEKYIERTMLSILDQNYPRLLYVVQDGGSKDQSPAIIARHAPRLRAWESARDAGQSDAIRRGFIRLTPELGPDDLMAWLNSDDLIGPGVLRYVAEYFAAHPDVDVIYGHRIIIDENDGDVGRWIMPRHDPHVLEWIDYVPQETLFWRKRAWDLAGGIDPSFQFALDWDLLARFQQAGCKLVRLPYFLGAFRVHSEQKTSQAIHTVGADEMARIRTRFHGPRQDDWTTIDAYARRTRFRGALVARLLALGIRW